MNRIKSNNLKYVMFFIVGLSLLLPTSIALSAQAVKKISGTKTLPNQPSTATTTGPIQSTTPSMKYQTIKKPPVKRLDIPEYDIAGELRNVIIKSKGLTRLLKYKIAIINKGTHKNSRNMSIPFKTRIINVLDQTLIIEEEGFLQTDLRNDYWVVSKQIIIVFYLRGTTAQTNNDLKVIWDIDPDNTFNEAQKFRGNNRCVVTW